VSKSSLLILVTRVVPDRPSSASRRRFDLAGAISGTGGLVLLVDALSQAPQYGWGATRTVAVLVASAALLVSFVAIAQWTRLEAGRSDDLGGAVA
jgi:hypothetical protein